MIVLWVRFLLLHQLIVEQHSNGRSVDVVVLSGFDGLDEQDKKKDGYYQARGNEHEYDIHS